MLGGDVGGDGGEGGIQPEEVVQRFGRGRGGDGNLVKFEVLGGFLDDVGDWSSLYGRGASCCRRAGVWLVLGCAGL